MSDEAAPESSSGGSLLNAVDVVPELIEVQGSQVWKEKDMS